MKRIFFSLILILPLIVFAQNSNKKAVAGETIKVPCSKIDSLLELAQSKKGCKYKYGGSGPKVFDCSGFTMYLYQQFGVSLPHGSITQHLLGRKVKKQDVRPGDLVFFYRSNCVGHVGMVLSVDTGKNVTFIHASTYKTGVKIDRLEADHYARTFAGARRIFECEDDSTYQLAYTDAEVAGTEAAAPAAPSTNGSYYYHRIKRGETLSTIANRYHVSVANIKKWNNLHSDRIREGNSLKIYRRTPTPAPTTQTAQTPAQVATTTDTTITTPVTASTTITSTEITTDSAATTTATTAPVNIPRAETTKPSTPQPTTPKAQPTTADGYTTHTIAKGESLYSIARRYGVTVEKIQQWNNITSPDKITAGQKLKIYNGTKADTKAPATTSKPNTSQNSSTIHVVKAGENLGRIAEKYNTTVEKIMQWNNLTNPDKISEGQKLKILQ